MFIHLHFRMSSLLQCMQYARSLLFTSLPLFQEHSQTGPVENICAMDKPSEGHGTVLQHTLLYQICHPLVGISGKAECAIVQHHVQLLESAVLLRKEASDVINPFTGQQPTIL